MTDQAPVEVTNLIIYGEAALPWSSPNDILAAPQPGMSGGDRSNFLGTVSPDGCPHTARLELADTMVTSISRAGRKPANRATWPPTRPAVGPLG
jgi:hypothetical protein